MNDVLEDVKANGKNDDIGRDVVVDMVDRCGDIDLLIKGADQQNAEKLQKFRSLVLEYLKSLEVELLHSEEWTPTVQRAISKKEDETISTSVVLRHVSLGIKIKKELLRKEEVVLLVPKKTNKTNA